MLPIETFAAFGNGQPGRIPIMPGGQTTAGANELQTWASALTSRTLMLRIGSMNQYEKTFLRIKSRTEVAGGVGMLAVPAGNRHNTSAGATMDGRSDGMGHQDLADAASDPFTAYANYNFGVYTAGRGVEQSFRQPMHRSIRDPGSDYSGIPDKRSIVRPHHFGCHEMMETHLPRFVIERRHKAGDSVGILATKTIDGVRQSHRHRVLISYSVPQHIWRARKPTS